MKTYPHVRSDGTTAYFEISSAFPWSWGFMRRVLAKVPGVSGICRVRSNDDRFAFSYLGIKCIVHEPFGDNSRYWIGPVEKDVPVDMAPIQEAFSRFTFPFTFDRDFHR